MTRKLLICPWFGRTPSWMGKYRESVATIARSGYDVLYDFDLDGFKRRVMDTLEIVCPITDGSSKIHDYRAAFGVLYADEIRGYDFWGHTDFDCVYGRVDQFFTEDLLSRFDVLTDNTVENNYVCGPWTLYRATPRIASIFRLHPEWQTIMQDPVSSGWVERGFTQLVKDEVEDFYVRPHHRWLHPDRLRMEEDRLMWGSEEISFFHFRSTKEWPL